MNKLYNVVPNASGRGYDVVRMAPTVVSSGLKWEEAFALSHALQDQISPIENPPK